MGNDSLLSRLPVLRLLLPLVVGIVLFRLTSSVVFPVLLVVMAAAALLIMSLVPSTPSSKLKMRQYRIVPLSLAMVAVGWGAAWVAEPVSLNVGQLNEKEAGARIETIKRNEKSMLMQVKLLDVGGSDRLTRDCHMLLSTRGCDYDLVAGDIIAFKLNLSKVHNMGNPDEMDYARYLHDKGIVYRQHIDLRELTKVGNSPTIMTRAFNLRESLQHKVLNSTLSPESQALIIAMLLGNDDFIEPNVRDSFSQAGIAHVLALSGLHVTVIALIIWFLLFPLDYVRGKKVRLVLTLAVLVAYVLLTGLSPSVIRSTVMIAFVFLSQIFYRKSSPLNAVAAAALVILVFSPNSLYGVGFQLSFITVILLLVFYEAFQVKYPARKILNYVCTVATTSAVAMISTMVLTAYYFNTISLVAVLSNVVVMPLLPVFMVAGALALVLLLIGAGLGPLAAVIDWITGSIETLASGMSSLSLAGGSVYVTWVAVVAYYVIVVMLGLWIYRRNVRWLLAAGAVLVGGLAWAVAQNATLPHRGLVIFNSFNSTPVLYFNGPKALLWVPDVENDFDMATFKRWNRSFLAHYGIDSLQLVDSVARELPGAVISPPYANFFGSTMVAAGKGRWKHRERVDSANVNFNVVLVTKGYHADVATLKNLYCCDSLILSGGIYEDDLLKLERECSQGGIKHSNIKQNGAYIRMEE